jgi:hypothetical protein
VSLNQDWLEDVGGEDEISQVENGPAEGDKSDKKGNLKWQVREANMADQFDVDQLWGDKINHTAYFYLYIESKQKLNDVDLWLGSDDTLKVFLNGEVIHTFNVDRGITVDSDKSRGNSGISHVVVFCSFSFKPFFNILKNACQAIEDKGRITITTSLKKNMVHVAIGDTGKGIKQDELESIFDPGFTTKGSVVRTRLGLSICYQIIQEHHGKINVDSQPGKGSVFTVILPTEF